MTTKNNIQIVARVRRDILSLNIEGEPFEYERPQLQGSQNVGMIQSTITMQYQQMVMHSASIAMQRKSYSPFSGKISIELNIFDLNSITPKDLSYSVKSILDGFNKCVYVDDSLVVNLHVWVHRLNKSHQKPYARVEVTEIDTKRTIAIKLDGPVVKKGAAYPYNIGGAFNYTSKFLQERKVVEQAFLSLRGKYANSYGICHINFSTSNMRKDIDNLFLTYFNELIDSGYIDQAKLIGFGMYKREAKKGEERTLISLLSM